MTTAKEFIETEFKRRTDLIYNENFRLKCIDLAKHLGISAKDYNDNHLTILLHFANTVCGIENKLQQNKTVEEIIQELS
jgi:hypothetical protein